MFKVNYNFRTVGGGIQTASNKMGKINKLFSIVAFSLCIAAVNTTKAQVTIVDSGTCGANLTWVYTSDSTLTISGSGAMDDYRFSQYTPWAAYQHYEITNVVIGDSVTKIGSAAFSSCLRLKSAIIGNGVKTIGSNAFAWSNNYSVGGLALTIPNGVTSIESGAFQGTGLRSVTIPDSLTVIENNVFQGCAFTSIIIPNHITSIGAYAFAYCGLTSITIPNSVTSIGAGAFRYCYSLQSVTLPDSITIIEERTFSNCLSLDTIFIPDNVTTIGDYNERFTASVGVCSLDNKCVTSPLVRRGKFSEPHACGKPLSR
jgi:hypothetical protein